MGHGESGSGCKLGGAANNASLVPANPCQYAGRALPPGAYVTQGQQANGNPINFALDVAMGLPRGDYLDPQPLGSGNGVQNAAYGNYVYGVYMHGGWPILNLVIRS